MKFEPDTSTVPSAPISGRSVRYSMDPAGIHATLVDVAADGESLNQAAKDTRTSGEKVSGAFGTAEVAAAAFNRFWAARDDVGERVASLVFRKAEAVSTAAYAFSQADSDMASTAVSKLPATYTSHSGGIRAVK